MSYSGPFNQEFRTDLLNGWEKELTSRKIPFTKDLNLTNMLVDQATVSVITANFLFYLNFMNYLDSRDYDLYTYTFNSENIFYK